MIPSTVDWRRGPPTGVWSQAARSNRTTKRYPCPTRVTEKGRACACVRAAIPWLAPSTDPRHAPSAARAGCKAVEKGKEETPMRGSRRRGEICNTQSTFKTSRCNTYNIRMNTDETNKTCVWNTCKKHLKTLETIVNTRNIQIKYL
jgi:hypothetical protein